MMFVMSLSVDSSRAAKSLDSHSQAITHTRRGGHKLAEGLLVSVDALIWGCGDRQITEPCQGILHISFLLLSLDFSPLPFMIMPAYMSCVRFG